MHNYSSLATLVASHYNGVMAEEEDGMPGSEETKVTTVRLHADQAVELEAIARVENIPVSEAIREAVAELIQRRRGDEEFMARLRRRVEEDREVLEKLARS
jgi:hypothetical protein